MEDLKLAVKNGAYWLDENHPGWASKIELENLEMDDCENCIVGQAIGEYSSTCRLAAGVDSYAGRMVWSVANGFDVPEAIMKGEDISLDRMYEQYRTLETLWTDQVQDRLNG